MRTYGALLLALIASLASFPLHAQDGAALYRERCAACHDRSAETRAPAPSALRQMSPENVVRALESGLMKEQGASLTAAQKTALAVFLTGKTIGQAAPQAKANTCPNAAAPFSPSGPSWNGWGADLANSRYQSAAQAGLNAADVPKLKLKWSFAFPGTFAAYGQPTVSGGRIFVPAANRKVYSLDVHSGCEYWSIETQAPVRAAITIATVRGEQVRQVAFFGDQRANAYAVDASSGELLWKVHVEDHPMAKIVGSPQYAAARLYVPITDAEEAPAMSPKFECCTGRGALVALDALTGKQIWKTYTIAEKAHPTIKNSAGTQMWGPSGASIWSAPTIDLEHKVIYAATGDNFSSPATKTSDAVLAFDLETGKLLWSKQITEQDVFNMACVPGPSKASCPEENGPDLDIGASPILAKAANGKRVLLVSQKSGVATGLDAGSQRRGAVADARRQRQSARRHPVGIGVRRQEHVRRAFRHHVHRHGIRHRQGTEAQPQGRGRPLRARCPDGKESLGRAAGRLRRPSQLQPGAIGRHLRDSWRGLLRRRRRPPARLLDARRQRHLGFQYRARVRDRERRSPPRAARWMAPARPSPAAWSLSHPAMASGAASPATCCSRFQSRGDN